jgi:hypothetical protein
MQKGNFIKYLGNMIVIVFLILFFISGCSKNGHYQKGNEYLSDKQYSAAIAEYQKVETGDKDFRLAQSKTNYIQGLLAFRDSLFQVAELRLQRVESDDEYYHDSQLMLDKIMQRNKITEAPKVDTLIVKEEITGTKGREKEPTKETVTAETDADITAKFVKQTKGYIENFESLYQSGYKAPVDSKTNYLNNMTSVKNKLSSLNYNAKEKNAEAIELNKKAAAWMNKRIEFISRLIKDNTIAETNTSRSVKEEGDKLYYALGQQMRKVK